MSKILRGLNSSQHSPWVVTPFKHSIETEFSEEPLSRNTFRRSFYQKVIIALCLILIGLHVKTMMMLKESQDQNTIALNQLYMQKSQLAELGQAAEASNSQLHTVVDALSLQAESFKETNTAHGRQMDAMSSEISQLKETVAMTSSRWEEIEKQYDAVMMKLSQSQEDIPGVKK